MARIDENTSAFKILIDQPKGMLLGRSRRIWEENVVKDIKEIGVNTRNWIDSAQDGDYWRVLLNAAVDLRIS